MIFQEAGEFMLKKYLIFSGMLQYVLLGARADSLLVYSEYIESGFFSSTFSFEAPFKAFFAF